MLENINKFYSKLHNRLFVRSRASPVSRLNSYCILHRKFHVRYVSPVGYVTHISLMLPLSSPTKFKPFFAPVDV